MEGGDGSLAWFFIGIWIDEGDGGHVFDVFPQRMLLEDCDAVIESKGVLPIPLVLLDLDAFDHVGIALELEAAVIVPKGHFSLDLIHRITEDDQFLPQWFAILAGQGLHLPIILHKADDSNFLPYGYFGQFLDRDAEIFHVGYGGVIFLEGDGGSVIDGHLQFVHAQVAALSDVSIRDLVELVLFQGALETLRGLAIHCALDCP